MILFTLKFKKSKSKFYPEAEKLATNFECHKFNGVEHQLNISIKEVFEKWDFFNLLFWKVVDWKGTSFGYEDFNLQSHSDKTRIFYALQWAHSTWININVDFVKNVGPAYFEDYINNLKNEAMKNYGISNYEELMNKALNVYR